MVFVIDADDEVVNVFGMFILVPVTVPNDITLSVGILPKTS